MTDTVAFATEFFPFATKISGEVANLRLGFTSLLLACHFAATFAKINKEMTKLFCFSQ